MNWKPEPLPPESQAAASQARREARTLDDGQTPPEINAAPKPTRTITVMNRAAVKKYALAVSKAKRAGKFTRVGETFLIGCEAELESNLRKLSFVPDGQTPTGGLKFCTKLTRQKALEKLEILAAVIIHGKVCRHPSLGQTLKD